MSHICRNCHSAENEKYILYTKKDLIQRANTFSFNQCRRWTSPTSFLAMQIIDSNFCNKHICKLKHNFLQKLRDGVLRLDWYDSDEFDVLSIQMSDYEDSRFAEKFYRKCIISDNF